MRPHPVAVPPPCPPSPIRKLKGAAQKPGDARGRKSGERRFRAPVLSQGPGQVRTDV